MSIIISALVSMMEYESHSINTKLPFCTNADRLKHFSSQIHVEYNPLNLSLRFTTASDEVGSLSSSGNLLDTIHTISYTAILQFYFFLLISVSCLLIHLQLENGSTWRKHIKHLYTECNKLNILKPLMLQFSF